MTIVPDHKMILTRLCWRKRGGGQWEHSEYKPMTEGCAKSLVEYMDRTFPEFEHWTETD